MSLHLGNLSSRVSRNDLERVFRRFGRCTIQVKDKYGFVVYDYPASAEKAMKKLQGTRICGEAITLSWSKRQPQHEPRSSRGGKMYGPPHRTFARREMFDRRLNNRPQYESQVGGEGRDNGLTEPVDEPGRNPNHQSDLKNIEIEARHSPSNDQHGMGNDGKNDFEDDRWEEDVVDYSDEKYENGIDFDRYEPINNDDEKDLGELQDYSPLTDSIPVAKSHEGNETGKCPLKLTTGLHNMPQGTIERGSSSKEQIDLNDSVGIEHVEYANKEVQPSCVGPSDSKHFTAGVKNQHQPREDMVEEVEIEKNQFGKDDNPSTSNASLRSGSLRLPSEEIYAVLKHYGLPYPNENEKDLPVEVYFGSARSWPWEIIYYRRLRKGSISAENYSRRTSQNKEFGIVDKYIRGSSGWAEPNKDDF